MPRLPRLSGRQVIKKLARCDYHIVGQEGSHVRLRHATKPPTTVPLHPTIGPGLLKKILRDTELTLEEFLDA